jgi:site-specific recombinase XerD
MSRTPQPSLETLLHTQIDELTPVLRPKSICAYVCAVNSFLRYLRSAYPALTQPADLCRDPHLIGWLRSLCDHHLRPTTRSGYVVSLRRLFIDLARTDAAQITEGLLLRHDLPRLDKALPRPLSPDDDHRLQQQLATQDDLFSNALLLIRRTGMRIGEFLLLPTNCIRHLGPHQCALHIPVGKLHTDRWFPADQEILQSHQRLLELRNSHPHAPLTQFLFPLPHTRLAAYHALHRALRRTAQLAGCAHLPTPHQLRHTFASQILRAGISLPALMLLLGHSNINMTMRYVEVVQTDLQREYHRARQALEHLHKLPQLPKLADIEFTGAIPTVRTLLATTRHALDMHRRSTADPSARLKLNRLVNRLAKIAAEVDRLS